MNSSPSRVTIGRDAILRLVSTLAVGFFGLVILFLSLFTTDFNPISQAASDYGIGSFAVLMNTGFFIGGIGTIAFAITLYQHHTPRTGSVLFFIDGVVLIVNAIFTTDPEGGSRTLHGLIHGANGGLFFFTAPIGLLLLAMKMGRTRLLITGIALIIGVSSFIVNDVFGLNAGGLAERIMIFIIFSWIIGNSLWPPYTSS